MPCKQRLDNFLFLPLICDIPYHHARLVMNQPFYGPTHGLPLHKLEKRVCLRCPPNGVTDSESLHVHIIDNKLLVLSVKTMYHSRGDSNLLHAIQSYSCACLVTLSAQRLAQQAKLGFHPLVIRSKLGCLGEEGMVPLWGQSLSLSWWDGGCAR